jgi:hypothetical protein
MSQEKQRAHDVIYGSVRTNPDCGKLPRADEHWDSSCKSVEAAVARLQLPRRAPAPTIPRFDRFAGDASSECSTAGTAPSSGGKAEGFSSSDAGKQASQETSRPQDD